MTPEEFEKNCIEAEKFQEEAGFPLEDAGFNVMVPGLRYGRTVRIDKGLSGANLGHYPNRETGEPFTMVFLKVEKVRNYLAKQEVNIP